MMSRYTWWRWRAIELTLAAALLFIIISATSSITMRLRADVAASNWFTVNEIYVPDFKIGEDPLLTYDRSIKEPFLGFWVIEVERDVGEGKFQLECTGSGVNDYQVADYIPKNQVTWSWFIGRRCEQVPPGDYRIRASWRMRRSEWPDKNIVKYSNMFKIAEHDAR